MTARGSHTAPQRTEKPRNTEKVKQNKGDRLGDEDVGGSLEGRKVDWRVRTREQKGGQKQKQRARKLEPAHYSFFFLLSKQGPSDLCFVRLNFPYQDLI
jgi:hypothetical protein